MEVLLVLAVVVAMVAIIWPAIDSSMETDALRQSGDRLRAALSHARVEAMRTGVIQAFRYEPQTGNYLIEPWQDEYSEVNATNPGSFESLSQFGQAEAGTLAENPNTKKLFEPAVFSDVAAQYSARASYLLQTSETEQILFFYPDGTATTGIVRIQIGTPEENNDYYVEVKLNGMTGLTKKSDMLTPDELTEVTQ